MGYAGHSSRSRRGRRAFPRTDCRPVRCTGLRFAHRCEEWSRAGPTGPARGLGDRRPRPRHPGPDTGSRRVQTLPVLRCGWPPAGQPSGSPVRWRGPRGPGRRKPGSATGRCCQPDRYSEPRNGRWSRSPDRTPARAGLARSRRRPWRSNRGMALPGAAPSFTIRMPPVFSTMNSRAIGRGSRQVQGTAQSCCHLLQTSPCADGRSR